jgi:hypothetical protein
VLNLAGETVDTKSATPSSPELTSLKALLAEVKANRDDLRQDRDDWRGRAERLLAGPQRQPWWRRLVG